MVVFKGSQQDRITVILESSFRNLCRIKDEVVIMRYDYQGLFLKKPPLTPQKPTPLAIEIGKNF